MHHGLFSRFTGVMTTIPPGFVNVNLLPHEWKVIIGCLVMDYAAARDQWNAMTPAEIAAAKKAWDKTAGWVMDIATFIADVHKKGHEAFVRAMLNGVEMPEMQKLSKVARNAVDVIFMILSMGEQWFNNLGNYKIGYGVGYIA